MNLDTDVLVVLQKAALQGRPIESTGLELTDEIRAAFEELKSQYHNAPPGSMAQIVGDIEWGSFDELIEATEKAHGPMFGDKTLKEMEEERRVEVARNAEKDR